jgi:methylaspartate mutase sigma subunit
MMLTAPRAPGLPVSGSEALSVLVTTVASDSHTWNLVYLELALTELGHTVRNLGPCVPADVVVRAALADRPDLVVVSTVNGHGYRDGLELIRRLRRRPELASLPVVIGGKLDIGGPARATGRDGRARLRAAGFDAVFEDGAGTVLALRSLPGLVRIGRAA